jgi:predicted esterase
MNRRTFLAGLVAFPVVSSCAREPARTRLSPPDEFSIRHNGADVRCLYHDRLISGARSGCLAIVLLHGADADASQWFDIGLSAAVDAADLGTTVERIVTIAPDIADHSSAAAMVVETLLPAIDPRFAPGRIAISGISRGAAVALDAARSSRVEFVSVGLHSPALGSSPIDGRQFDWPCWIDCGSDDSLASQSRRAAAELARAGIDVSEHSWPGGHDRTYWRRHLPDYLAFHLDAAQRSLT